MKKAIVACLCLFAITVAHAQQDRNTTILRSASLGLEYSIRAGINIGGTSPIPLPVEIRELESYDPTLCFSLEGNVLKRFGDKWGIQLGLRLDTKGMKTGARVKNYHMRITASGDSDSKEGNFTGHVKTKVRNSYITFPLLGVYRLTNRWNLKLGPYFSYALDREFSGTAYDGYLRDGTPIGTKVYIDANDPATYDLSADLRRFQWGAQAGAEWRAFSHLAVFADLQVGLNSVFRKDFETITFEMYPIYATFGFAYVF